MKFSFTRKRIFFFIIFFSYTQIALSAYNTTEVVNKKILIPVNKNISINFKNTELSKALNILGSHSNKNIIISENVTGYLTLNIKDAPWSEVFNAVLEMKDLVVIGSETLGILKIYTSSEVDKIANVGPSIKFVNETKLIKTLIEKKETEIKKKEAKKQNSGDTALVTFQEVLENPSDLVVNLTYATEQESIGNYRSTISTLERLNMLYPVNTDLKLYLISVLLKMDSEVKLQLMVETMLQDPNTTEETRKYIEEIIKNIKKQPEPKGKWFAYLDLSYMQTDNSNIDGVSKSKTLYAQDNIQEFPGLGYDKTFSRGSSFTIGKNLNSTSAISLTGGLTVNTQNKGDTYESDVKSGSLTYTKVLGKHFLIPYIFYSRPNERQLADLNTKGFGFNNTYSLDKTKSISYGSSFSTSSYNKKSSIEDEVPDNDNNQIYSSNIGYNYTFFDKNLINTKISYTEKKAKADYNAYTAPRLDIGYTRVLPFGNLRLNKSYQTSTYDEKNTFIHSTIEREDDIENTLAQLSGSINQLSSLFQFIDPNGKIFYNLSYFEVDTDSTLLNNSSLREITSFKITKRLSLYE